MFAEVDFDDGEDSRGARENSKRPLAEHSHPPPCGSHSIVHFHQPGEEGFSIVAGACDDVDARHDSHFISGDAWMSKKCYCIRCETIRVMKRHTEISARPNAVPLIILVDLDNFGFNQFKSIPPHSDVELLDNVLVWGFFGSCFTRYHQKWPSAESVCEPLPRRSIPTPGSPAKRSIWEILVEKSQVFFTPCGGQRQAADAVMQQVLHALHGIETVLLTGDVKLIDQIYRDRRLLGVKSQRDNEDNMTDRLTVINVDDMDKRFIPVWRALCHRIRGVRREAVTGGCSDSSEDQHICT